MSSKIHQERRDEFVVDKLHPRLELSRLSIQIFSERSLWRLLTYWLKIPGNYYLYTVAKSIRSLADSLHCRMFFEFTVYRDVIPYRSYRYY